MFEIIEQFEKDCFDNAELIIYRRYRDEIKPKLKQEIDDFTT